MDWKLADVVPVLKKDNKKYAENYRPISLLCLVSKVIERCVFNSTKDHVYGLIESSQHGFITVVRDVVGRGTRLHRPQLDNGGQVDVIYIDMSKAFDKVTHANYTGSCVITVSAESFWSGWSPTSTIGCRG